MSQDESAAMPAVTARSSSNPPTASNQNEPGDENNGPDTSPLSNNDKENIRRPLQELPAGEVPSTQTDDRGTSTDFITLIKPSNMQQAGWLPEQADGDTAFWRIARAYYPVHYMNLVVYLVYVDETPFGTTHWARLEDGRPLEFDTRMQMYLNTNSRSARWYIVRQMDKISLIDGTQPQGNRIVDVDTSIFDPATLYENFAIGIRRLFPRGPEQAVDEPTSFVFAGASRFAGPDPQVQGEFSIPSEDSVAFFKRTIFAIEEPNVFVWPRSWLPSTSPSEVRQLSPVPIGSVGAQSEAATEILLVEPETQQRQGLHGRDRPSQGQNNPTQRQPLMPLMNLSAGGEDADDLPHMRVLQNRNETYRKQLERMGKEIDMLRIVIDSSRICFSGSCGGDGNIGVPDGLNEAVDLSNIFWNHYTTYHTDGKRLEERVHCSDERCHARLDTMSQTHREQHMEMHEIHRQTELDLQSATNQLVEQVVNAKPGAAAASDGRTVYEPSPSPTEQAVERQQKRKSTPAKKTSPAKKRRHEDSAYAASNAGEETDDDGSEAELREPPKLDDEYMRLYQSITDQADKEQSGFDDSNQALKVWFYQQNLKVCNICLETCRSYDQARGHFAQCETSPWNFVTASDRGSGEASNVPFAMRHKTVPPASVVAPAPKPTQASKRKQGGDAPQEPSAKRQKRGGADPEPAGPAAKSAAKPPAKSAAKPSGKAAGRSTAKPAAGPAGQSTAKGGATRKGARGRARPRQTGK